MPFVGVDVSHLYGMQLARAHVVPRTLREGVVSGTSTSWLDRPCLIIRLLPQARFDWQPLVYS